MNGVLELVCPVRGGDLLAAGEAAAKIKNVLRQLGASPDVVRRASIVAYEAEMNIVIHAYSGILKAAIGPGQVVLVAEDEGPGIEDIELAMQEGYSTAPERIREMGFGAGMGLPNMKKFSDSLQIRSTVGKGTTVEAVIRTE